MGMVMVKCPRTGHAIPTGIKTDRESFSRSAVFFARTRCPICGAEHAWFAREAWVDEPGIRVRRQQRWLPGVSIETDQAMYAMEGRRGTTANPD